MQMFDFKDGRDKLYLKRSKTSLRIASHFFRGAVFNFGRDLFAAISIAHAIFYFVSGVIGSLSLIKLPRLINHRPIFAPVLRQSWQDLDDVSSQIEA